MSKNWLNIRNQAGITEIYIDGDIESERNNEGFSEILGLKDNNIYPSMIRNALKESETGEVHVHINSYGGDVFAGVAICNMLKNHKGKTIAHINGLAASVASVIAFGCDEIIMPSNAYMMIHRAICCNVSGNVDDLLKKIEILEKLEDGIANSYVEKALEGTTKESILNFMKEEHWFTGNEAARYFNIKLEEPVAYLNYLDTNQKFKNIPQKILNSISQKADEEKERTRIENMKKEIEITLKIGGIK